MVLEKQLAICGSDQIYSELQYKNTTDYKIQTDKDLTGFVIKREKQQARDHK
ncbi:hypothetical protein THOD04_50140 [Vibrio owensii]|nr:hypothetical protein THOD04_50140 [Vibrio owensii]